MEKSITNFTFNAAKKSMFILLLCIASLTQSKAQTCHATFYYNPVQSMVVQFTDTSYTTNFLDSIVSYSWSFGDGTYSTVQSPMHTYNSPQQFLACLTITTALGCTDSTCQVISLNPCPNPPQATIFVDSINNSMTVNAFGGSAPYSYLWSTGANTATITNLTPGTYCVYVTDANGCTTSACASTSGNGCVATFTYTMNGQTVTFSGAISGGYSNVLWNFGDGDTSSLLTVSHTYAAPGTYTPCLNVYDSIGNIVCQYCTYIFVQANPTSNVCGTVFIDLNGNGVQDSTEVGLANQYVAIYGGGIQQYAMTDSLGFYNFFVPNGTYTVYYCPDSGYTMTIPVLLNSNCGSYNVTVFNQTICGNNFGVQQNTVVITGTVFSDNNNNGVLDGGEFGIPYQTVQVGNYTAYTNANGVYYINLPIGTFTVGYIPNGAYSIYPLTTPGSIIVNALVSGTTYGNNNFGILIPAGTSNLSVSIVPWTNVVPGQPAWYHIYVTNIGPTPTPATLTMNYDANLNYNYATPTEFSHNLATHTLTWNLPLIAPGTTSGVTVDFTASTSVLIGTNTFELVDVLPTIGTDVDLSNNFDSVHQVVASSWDPNNKLVKQTNNSDPRYQVVSSLNANQQIEYTINFQNTGTSPAINVVVEDELSSLLDENSFELVQTSHPCFATRNGSKVVYKFSNIMLPDSNSNEPASHGSISFRVNANNGLSAGLLISDFANIYFDYNSAVVTNNTSVTMINPTGINSIGNNSTNLAAMPNPSNGNCEISYSLTESSDVKLDVIDATGKVCAVLLNEKQIAGKHQAQLKEKLNIGFYTLRLTINNSQHQFKFSVVY